MSSQLLSPGCLDPLQGMLDFTADAKPFRTKVVQAAVSLNFEETMIGSFVETFELELDQLFHRHRGHCKVAPIPCEVDGFETEPYGDPVRLIVSTNVVVDSQIINGETLVIGDVILLNGQTAAVSENGYYLISPNPNDPSNPNSVHWTPIPPPPGFEPTIRYDIVEQIAPDVTYSVTNPNFIGYSAKGNPIFVVVPDCTEPPSACPEGFEEYSYDLSAFESYDDECIETCNGTYIGSCTPPIDTPPIAQLTQVYYPCVDPTVPVRTTYPVPVEWIRLQKGIPKLIVYVNSVRVSHAINTLVPYNIDLSITPSATVTVVGTVVENKDTITLVFPKQNACTNSSVTTITTSFLESLLIEDIDGGVIVNIIGSTPIEILYARESYSSGFAPARTGSLDTILNG